MAVSSLGAALAALLLSAVTNVSQEDWEYQLSNSHNELRNGFRPTVPPLFPNFPPEFNITLPEDFEFRIPVKFDNQTMSDLRLIAKSLDQIVVAVILLTVMFGIYVAVITYDRIFKQSAYQSKEAQDQAEKANKSRGSRDKT